MSASLVLRGILKGHDGWVTSLATSAEKPDLLLSGSRDKSVMAWELKNEEGACGVPRKCMRGHAHFVQDVTLSSDGQFALSASWDGCMRLWDLSTGETTRRFQGHAKDVLSVAFSADNRQIVSGSRDGRVFLWNTLAECKVQLPGSDEWVSCVRFSPNTQQPLVVSCGWDHMVRVWDMTTYKLRATLVGHTGYVNTVNIAPDGSLCASAGKDGQVLIWDLNETKYFAALPGNSIVHALAFSPNRYLLASATEAGLRLWDVEKKTIACDITRHSNGMDPHSKHYPVSVAWSADGLTLFAGYTDGLIRVFSLAQ